MFSVDLRPRCRILHPAGAQYTAPGSTSIAANLNPVGEDLAIATVGNELMRVLGHPVVKVVHDHVHDGRRLYTPGWVLLDRVRPVQGGNERM